MKKLIILILALVLCFSLTACELPDFISNIIGGGNVDEPEYHLDNAATYLKNLYKDQNPVTASDYEVVGQVMIKGVKYTVTWATDNDKITIEPIEGSVHYLVNIDEKSETVENYTLTATITAGNGESIQVVFEGRQVPEYEVLSFEEYMAAAEGDTVVIEGIVTAINAVSLGNKRNHIFLVDASGKGGYYSYQMPDDPAVAGIEVGMTVSVTGEIAPYSGMQEIKGGTAKIVDSTIKEVVPVDLTEVFANATSETSFKNYVGMLVTVKGVELGTQDLETASSQYLYFTIGEIRSYVRTYVTDMIGGASADEKAANKAAIDALHAEKFGWKADVTGIVVLYSGNPYFIPVGAEPFTNLELVEKTPAEKIEAEIEGLGIPSKVTSETVLTLPSVGKFYDDVTITWTLNGEAVTESTTLTPTETPTEVTLVATLVCGEVTETKEYVIELNMAPISIPEVIASEDGTPVIVEGIVTEINTPWSDQYGNISVTIRDGEGNTLYIFRLATNVQVGDAVKITGKVGSYNGSKQIAAGATAEITGHYTEVSIPDAIAAEDGTLVIVKGTVKEINTPWSDQYGNITVTIEDADGNTLYIYRLATNVEVGDSVVITGKVGSYKDAKQIAAGAKAMKEVVEEVPEMSISDALAAADDTKVVVTGTVVTINTAWSDSYGNISVTIEDEAGNQLYIFRLATKVALGDVIKVTGVMDTYNDARQIAAGAKAVIVTEHEHDYADATCGAPQTCKVCGKTQGEATGEHTWVDATCTAPKTCSVCKSTEGEALGHDYVDGVCTRCEAEQPGEGSVSNALLDFAVAENRTSFTTEVQVWEANGVKLTNNKADSTSNVADYTNPARFYKNSSVTIEANGMTTIVFTANNASYATVLANSIGTPSGVLVVVEGSVVTVTFDSAVNSFTFSLSAGQARVNSLVVNP